MEVLISLGLYKPPDPRLVFGSVQDRPLLPTLPSAAPPTRLGASLSRDCRPRLGPGRYKIEDFTGFVYQLDRRTRSKRGVMFGASTEPRPPKDRSERVPSPGRHQADLNTPWPSLAQRRTDPDRAQPPFDQTADRFYDSRHAQASRTPGPGTYRPEQCKIRKELRRSYSFGGKTEVLPSIRVKCVAVQEDMCNVCERKPCGDYYENIKEQLCRECYQRLIHKATAYTAYSRQYMETFEKVRDCSDIHQHNGTDAALKLKSDREIRDLQNKEAYMSLYF
ncbi:Protein pitchfork [Amphibalanus amphitrite]|uniref:Protein pitchfork n=1 Tax=Amphibalanus amphitrite TaxID=1232801 RepID=A0A6A4W6L1_AMPAM|nr:Protein pitchfork [Amphibalanus amphitrite]